MKGYSALLSTMLLLVLTSTPDALAAESGSKSAAMSTDTNTPLADFPDSLLTDTPREGFELAIKLSRLGVKATQPDIDVLKRLRDDYASDAEALIAVSHVVAVHYQTIAAANGYWRVSETKN